MVCDYDDGLIIPALPYEVYCSASGVIFYMFLLLWCFLGVALIAGGFTAIHMFTNTSVTTAVCCFPQSQSTSQL